LIDYLFFRNNRLVGTTTAKDLGLFIKTPTLQALQGNVFDFLKIIRAEQIDERNPCISVMPYEKLSRAVGLLAATRVHRIFIVDDEENFQPVSVLSITDVLKFLIKK
jgi:CBS-domain-containing membrane protein